MHLNLLSYILVELQRACPICAESRPLHTPVHAVYPAGTMICRFAKAILLLCALLAHGELHLRCDTGSSLPSLPW